MKTTIEIPDELFREAKARAAMDGIKLKDLITDALRTKLSAPPVEKRHRVMFQIIEGNPDGRLITDEIVNAAIEDIYRQQFQIWDRVFNLGQAQVLKA